MLRTTWIRGVPRVQVCQAARSTVAAIATAARSAPKKPVRMSGQQTAEGAQQERKQFTIAVEGCCHGELDNIYATLEYMQKTKGQKVDLLICCGDFQAVRNLDDLETMSVPPKYRSMMTFWKYYSGEKQAPIPTLFIGGNHEASNYLRELYYGGWAAPNIYFLGFAGCVQFGGHRIAGLSGTYVSQHFHWGHHEQLPYDDKAVKSIYHVRQLEVHRLMQLHGDISLFLSHDWPNEITRYGDKERLFRNKPYFQKEAERGDLGSPPNQQLLHALQPEYWFAAHLHCKFAAVVPHTQQQPGSQQQQQQQWGAAAGGNQFQLPGVAAAATGAAAAGAAGAAAAAAAGADASSPKVTRFLALDKCLPRRDFLQLITLDVKGPLELQYDPEWLAVLRSTHQLYSASKYGMRLPEHWGGRTGPTQEDLVFVQQALQQKGSSSIPSNFVQTAAAYNPAAGVKRGNMPRVDARNPQTLQLLELLGLSYNLDTTSTDNSRVSSYVTRQQGAGVAASGRGTHYQSQTSLLSQQQRNPEEIDLDSDDDDEDGQQQQQLGDKEGEQQAAAAAAGAGAAEEEGPEEERGPGGALADGAPDSDDDAAEAAAAADAQLDDEMFGAVNTTRFPYYHTEV